MYKPLLTVTLLMLTVAACAQSASHPEINRWADWAQFLGNWEGTGTGEPGQGAGRFSFEKQLQGAVLVRHSYAEYPASENKPAYRHDDLMVIYPGPSRGEIHADYWDSEGHVIRYEVKVSADKLIFMSDPNQPGPRFRLTYIKVGQDTLRLAFDIAQPNDRENFKPYIEALARRISPNP